MAGKIEQTEQVLTESMAHAEQALTTLNDVVEGNEDAGGLPEGWESSSLKDLFQFVIGGDWGKAPDFEDENFKEVFCIRGSEFKNWKTNYGSTSVPRKIKSSSLETRKLQDGDILVEISGGGPDQPVGRTVLIENHVISQFKSPVVCTNFLRLTRPFLSVNSKYLNGYLTSFYMSGEVTKYQGGSNNLRNLKFKEFETIQIPLPPLAEQTVIAQTLDTLLAQVDNIKTRLDAIPKILKTFRQSVLAAAVSGKLTEAWRGENECEPAKALKQRWLSERLENFQEKQRQDLESGKIKRSKKYKDPAPVDLETGPIETYPASWELVSVSEFAECLDPERIPVKKDQRVAAKGLYPYFGANGEVDRVDGYLFDDELVMVTEDETFYGRIKPIAYRYSGKCWVNNHAHVLRAPTKVANDFLCFTLMYYKVIPWLSGTTGRAKLTQAALNSLPMGMPPEKEQTQIVHRVEELFAFAEQIEQQVKNAQKRVNTLTQSILAKAFRGELTTQWRAENPDLITGDNSAEALLANIKEERDALKQKAKPKKKTALKKAVVGKK